MTPAEEFYAWVVVLMFTGVLLIAFGAVATGLLPTRARQHRDEPYDWAVEGDFTDDRDDLAAWEVEMADGGAA